MPEKIVLAYSGGLDTSVAVKWLMEERNYEVIALTVDMGIEREREDVQSRASAAGAVSFHWLDAKDTFMRHFAFPALAAGAVYEGQYPLATALGRPLIAKLLVDTAREEGATAVAHGSTGKGNDQVRFDVSVQALAPDLKIVAPARDWGMTREEEIAYAQRYDLPIPVTKESPYSTDENMWGRSIEAGPLEDPWLEPPEDIYEWTRSVKDAPDKPRYVEIGFQRGMPVSLDGQEVDPVTIVQTLNQWSGEHGVGRIDHLENRLVGIKSREIYEAPAAVTLLSAHQALEYMTLSKAQVRMKAIIAQEYADLVYNGLWFSVHHQDLAAYVQSTQRHVTGTVRMRLHKGQATPAGTRSPKSLYDFSLATYDKGDVYDQSHSVGFIGVWGLPLRVQARAQLLAEPGDPLHIATPREREAE
jgi:argininosuccinate synthase